MRPNSDPGSLGPEAIVLTLIWLQVDRAEEGIAQCTQTDFPGPQGDREAHGLLCVCVCVCFNVYIPTKAYRVLSG